MATWGSYSSEQMSKVWTVNNNYTGLELFCVRVYWKYRSSLDANQTEIYVTKIRFEETSFLCLAGQSVTLEAGWSGNSTSGTIALAQNFGPPYYVDLAVNKYKVFNNTSDGYATGLNIQWRASVTGSDWRRPTFSSLQTYSIASSSIPKLNLVSNFTLSKTSCEMGSSFNIAISASSSSYTHKVTYSFGGSSGTIDSASTAGSRTVTYTPPVTLAQKITTSTSGTMTVTVQTLSSGTAIGTKSKTITLTVPSSVKATISSVSITDSYSKPSGITVYIQTLSQLRIVTSTNTSASTAQGATVKSVAVTFDGVTYSGSTVTTSKCMNSGSRTVSVTITDSRGRTTTSTQTVTIVAYSKPKVTSFSIARCSQTGVVTDEGRYGKIIFAYTISSLSNQNGKSAVIQYLNSATWTNIASYTDYTKSTSIITGNLFDANTSYTLKITVSDSIASTTVTTELPVSFALINWHKDGHAMAFGKKSSGNGIEFGLSTYDKFGSEIRGESFLWFDDASMTVGAFLQALNAAREKKIENAVSVMMKIPSAWSPTGGALWVHGFAHRQNAPDSTYDHNFTFHFYDTYGRCFTGQGYRSSADDPYGSDAYITWQHNYCLELVYPVGAIYLSMSSTNPRNIFGFGTWVQISGRALIGAGTYSDSAGTSKTFTSGNTYGLYYQNIKKTDEEVSGYGLDKVLGFANRVLVAGDSPTTDNLKSNMQPSVAVYIWRRTA